MRFIHFALIAAAASAAAFPLVLALEDSSDTPEQNVAAERGTVAAALDVADKSGPLKVVALAFNDRWPLSDWTSAAASRAASKRRFEATAEHKVEPATTAQGAPTEDQTSQIDQNEQPAKPASLAPLPDPVRAPAIAENAVRAPAARTAQATTRSAAANRKAFAQARATERKPGSKSLGYYYEIADARGFGEARVKRACVPGLRMPQVCYYPQNIRRNFPVRAAD